MPAHHLRKTLKHGCGLLYLPLSLLLEDHTKFEGVYSCAIMPETKVVGIRARGSNGSLPAQGLGKLFWRITKSPTA
jgi:hypothetical protein